MSAWNKHSVWQFLPSNIPNHKPVMVLAHTDWLGPNRNYTDPTPNYNMEYYVC